MKFVVIVLVFSVFIGYTYYKFHELTGPLPAPLLDTTKYWGPGDGAQYKADTTIKSFVIRRRAEEIETLRTQLLRPVIFTEPLEGINFEYGYNTKALRNVITYWRDNYLPRWAEREQYLNSLPQFTTEIQGLRIHFIHAKPSAEALKTKKVLPLLLLHGWGGSVREFYDFIPLLTKPSEMSEYVFEVIAPSLVGYGWSQDAAKTGLNPAQMAIIMRNLMLRVGHDKFVIQGGDWGSVVGSAITTLFPENVVAYHSNMCMVNTPLSFLKRIIVSLFPEKFLPSLDFYKHHFPSLQFAWEETGYFHLQATKPDTIGVALSTSPIGLAAYILEKFQTSTGFQKSQKFDSLATVYTLDALLDNLMIYYLSNTATSSVRLYAEALSSDFLSLKLDRVPSLVPMGCARFINDLPSGLDWQLKDKFHNLIHSKYYNHGGHFAAFEVPVTLYIDFVQFVSKLKLTDLNTPIKNK